MRIIPVVNCVDFEAVKKRILIADRFLPEGEKNIHIDISDGRFTPVETWNDPSMLRSFLDRENLKISFSVHVMAKSPESYLDQWLSSGAEKIIVPVEAVGDALRVASYCRSRGATPVLSASPETQADELVRRGRGYTHFQILAVSPGPSGQIFRDGAISKIFHLRHAVPSAIIEVDGGITPEIAQRVMIAGADIVVSGSYIFSSDNPAEKYQELKKAVKQIQNVNASTN